MAPPLTPGGKTSVIIEMLVVTMHAEPNPMTTLHAMRNQNEGENTATRHTAAMTATPNVKILFLPNRSPALAIGTMNTTDESRNAVFT